ncbi:hypothetical protein CRM22_002589 [Opisthorchis felineus]|uniref:Uncharacterized protein n=1 Tax=Opisthorchis felineus TaxID=147828 RepID=A0A4S2M590_OPIFE|nr:hypothetical protein CRM22_002589 [Opisthorchis felineus]
MPNFKVNRESWYSRESTERVQKSSSSEDSLEQMKPRPNYRSSSQTQNTLMKRDNSRLQEKPPQGRVSKLVLLVLLLRMFSPLPNELQNLLISIVG